MQTLGWIGLGHMGTPMALNLLQAGYKVNAYNRTPDKTTALAQAGATIRNTPAEVVAASDITFIMLSDANAIRSVLTQGQGILEAIRPGKLVVDMSTIAPEDSVAFAQAVADRGGLYVDAPVSGSVGAAKAKQLVILAGGDASAIETCQPHFSCLGIETINFGATGKGSAAKLAINLLLGITGQGFGEALMLAENQGVEKELMLELIGKSALSSPFFQLKKELYRQNDFPAAFMVSLMAKDLGLISEEADRLGLILPLAKATAETYRAAKEHGKADMDMAAVYLELKEQRLTGKNAGAAQSAIVWPEAYTPGATDNYVSNEIIVPGLSAADVWPFLDNTTAWPTYYSNASEIRFHDGSGPGLSQGARFRFTTFGFPVEAEVTEYEPPVGGRPGRVAWHGWVEGDAETRLDVHHAWLFEDLPGGRVRILTQETQIGKPAQELAQTRPNPMLNAHQEWIDGLARAALERR